MIVLYALKWFFSQLACIIMFVLHWIFQSPLYAFYGAWSFFRKLKGLPDMKLEDSPVSSLVILIEGLTLAGMYAVSF